MAEQIAQDHQLQRRLTNRHIQLIAIGGAIGTVSYTHLTLPTNSRV